jgi:hypothetical protein
MSSSANLKKKLTAADEDATWVPDINLAPLSQITPLPTTDLEAEPRTTTSRVVLAPSTPEPQTESNIPSEHDLETKFSKIDDTAKVKKKKMNFIIIF